LKSGIHAAVVLLVMRWRGMQASSCQGTAAADLRTSANPPGLTKRGEGEINWEGERGKEG
jgi:hypothetical protein